MELDRLYQDNSPTRQCQSIRQQVKFLTNNFYAFLNFSVSVYIPVFAYRVKEKVTYCAIW